MAKTKKPTGLTITRNGGNFECKWTIADADYGNGQQLQYKYIGVGGGWFDVPIGKTTVKKTISAGVDIPHMTGFAFRVRGNRKKYTTGSGKKKKTINPGYSDWSRCEFALNNPRTPSASAARNEAYRFSSNFSWSVGDADAGSHYPFREIEYQSMLVRECNETNGAKLNWSSSQYGWVSGGRAQASGTINIDDTAKSGELTKASYTRWFRVRAFGPWLNATGWSYSKIVYAVPYAPRITEAKVNYQGNSMAVTVGWTVDANNAHPVTSSALEWAVETPLANWGCPSGASWQDVEPAYTGGAGAKRGSFNVGSSLDANECLFVRAKNTYDSQTSYSTPVLAAYGYLSDPSGISVEVNQSTFRATISATNNSNVPNSHLAVTLSTNKDPKGFIVGVIPHGQDSVTVQCPNWSTATSITFSVQAFAGDYFISSRADGASTAVISPRMRSKNVISQGGDVPQFPRNITVNPTEETGTIRVTWQWSWDKATGAQIAWADHKDAWESTEEPSIYTVGNINASAWNISNLETGITWYVRMRYITESGDDITYGPWSNIQEIDLSSAPAIPVLVLSSGVITADGSVTASWVYSTTDGSTQAFAEIAEYELNGSTPVYTPILQTRTAQYATLSAKDYGWQAGETHSLVVRVRSASGRLSDGWSDPVNLIIADPLTLNISETSLVEETITPEEGDPYTQLALKEMPLTLTIEGTKIGTTTTVVIERAEAFRMDRPDESVFNGYEGETIAIMRQNGDGQMTITLDDLIGHLDDGAAYRIIATVQDGFGQTAEATIEFVVNWTHQAIIPEASVTIDEEQLIAIITPIAPAGTLAGDVCDIYRLSADKPQLIVENATFGTTYVDPFPAIGEFGGHRFVFKTSNGDYITEDNHLAWLDTGEDEGDNLDLIYSVVNFGNGRVELLYDSTQSNQWEKDFQETKYLGGSIQGDWNPAVSMTSSVEVAMVTIEDQESMMAMRRLAAWPGICHLRTVDGSSYPCDIQVSEDRRYDQETIRATYSLSTTRVDPEELDGMTLEEWNNLHQEDEVSS